jgi:hypothetical protein
MLKSSSSRKNVLGEERQEGEEKERKRKIEDS